MGLHDLQAGLRLVEEHGEEADFAGARPEELIERAEAALGLRLPPSYRAFVGELGAGDIAGEEFFGVTSADFEISSVPNGIWLTLSEREDSGLPEALVVVYSVGDGTLYALDTAQAGDDGEAPVVAWVPGMSASGEELETIAADFGTFFRKTVESALWL